jgi:hypothetical protein
MQGTRLSPHKPHNLMTRRGKKRLERCSYKSAGSCKDDLFSRLICPACMQVKIRSKKGMAKREEPGEFTPD